MKLVNPINNRFSLDDYKITADNPQPNPQPSPVLDFGLPLPDGPPTGVPSAIPAPDGQRKEAAGLELDNSDGTEYTGPRLGVGPSSANEPASSTTADPAGYEPDPNYHGTPPFVFDPNHPYYRKRRSATEQEIETTRDRIQKARAEVERLRGFRKDKEGLSGEYDKNKDNFGKNFGKGLLRRPTTPMPRNLSSKDSLGWLIGARLGGAISNVADPLLDERMQNEEIISETQGNIKLDNEMLQDIVAQRNREVQAELGQKRVDIQQQEADRKLAGDAEDAFYRNRRHFSNAEATPDDKELMKKMGRTPADFDLRKINNLITIAGVTYGLREGDDEWLPAKGLPTDTRQKIETRTYWDPYLKEQTKLSNTVEELDKLEADLLKLGYTIVDRQTRQASDQAHETKENTRFQKQQLILQGIRENGDATKLIATAIEQAANGLDEGKSPQLVESQLKAVWAGLRANPNITIKLPEITVTPDGLKIGDRSLKKQAKGQAGVPRQ